METGNNKAETSRIGLALGSGSARGWAHIGVIRELDQMGIQPDIICGSSIGALVGASHAGGQLDALEAWVRKLTMHDMMRLLDISISGGGLIQGNKLIQAFCEFVNDTDIEMLSLDYGAVATDLGAGREVWLDHGSLITAVRASIALPGLFSPVKHQDRWLVDGGLVNPVPVSMCRAMGADIVIAVNLNHYLTGNRSRRSERESRLAKNLLQHELLQKFSDALPPVKRKMDALLSPENDNKEAPGMFEAMTSSIDIMQDRITKSRLAGDPPDVLINPHLAHMGLLEFDRSSEAIDEGIAAVRSARSSGAFRALSGSL